MCEPIEININGLPLDPHLWEEVEEYRNATVIVRRCANCGEVSIAWKRQGNTEKVKGGEA